MNLSLPNFVLVLGGSKTRGYFRGLSMRADIESQYRKAFAASDYQLIDQLVSRYYPELLNFLMRMGCPVSDADDMIQDTFIKAIRSMPPSKDETICRAWLFKVCHNNLRDHYKKAYRRRELPYDPDIIATSGFNPENTASTVDAALQVQSALKRLPPKQRLAVVLYYYHGFSIKEIAALARCPSGTVKSRLHNALQCLRTIIEEGETE